MRLDALVLVALLLVATVVLASPSTTAGPIIAATAATATSSGYIMVECDEGLANRLRVLLTHLFLGKYLHNGAHLGRRIAQCDAA
jgi:hypothetical protein